MLNFIQQKFSKNFITLKFLRLLGYREPDIRRALMDLNGLTLSSVADGKISVQTVAATIKDARTNPTAQTLFAQKLGIYEKDIFNGC